MLRAGAGEVSLTPAFQAVRHSGSVKAVSTGSSNYPGKPLKRLDSYRMYCTGLKAGVNEMQF
jgi:hypothetical protein